MPLPQTYKGLTIRGDWCACQLPLGVDIYWGCAYACEYCTFRDLATVWPARKALDLVWFAHTMSKPPAKGPSGLGAAIRARMTLRFGNKFDPFQPEEDDNHVAQAALDILEHLHYPVKVQTKNAWAITSRLGQLHRMKAIVTSTVPIGLSDDAVLEPNTSSAMDRLYALSCAVHDTDCQVSTSAEPWIPGWHTLDQWGQYLFALRYYGIHRTNVYPLTMSPRNLRRLAQYMDVEKVYAERRLWLMTLPKMLDMAEAAGITVGCPDWANLGVRTQGANTCCGVDVPVPSRFNLVTWHDMALTSGCSMGDILDTYQGVGEVEDGMRLALGDVPGQWSLSDCPELERVGDRWQAKA